MVNTLLTEKKGLSKTGAYTEGIKTGTWETFNPRGKVTWSETFEGINCQKRPVPIHASDDCFCGKQRL